MMCLKKVFFLESHVIDILRYRVLIINETPQFSNPPLIFIFLVTLYVVSPTSVFRAERSTSFRLNSLNNKHYGVIKIR